MLPDRVSNPGPLSYESGALPIALRGPARLLSLTTSVSTICFLLEILFILMAIKSILKSHIINRILHGWSFHMKFMTLAKGLFHKFHMT